MNGNPTEDHDTVFVDSYSYVMDHVDKTLGAPVQPNQNLKKLNFSFVGKDNQLMVNIDEQNSRINKRGDRHSRLERQLYGFASYRGVFRR